MGIRVRKVLGYGFVDLLFTKDGTDDPRINLGEEVRERLYDRTKEEYLEYLQAMKKDNDGNYELSFAIGSVKDLEHWSPSDSVRHDDEYGLKNVLVFTPPGFKDWYRYDDMIDYVEETYLSKRKNPTMPRVKSINVPLYPFLGFMDKNTGKKFTREENDIAFCVARIHSAKDSVPDEFRSVAERMVPEIPPTIRYLAEFSGIVKPEFVKDMRPLLYTYWS